MNDSPASGLCRRRRAGLALAGLFILAVLTWLAWSPLPYEQDELGKAGKIVFMSSHRYFLSPLKGPDFYRDNIFSVYYMASSVLHACWGANIFREMNETAAVFGAVFFVAVAAALRKVFKLPVWLTALLALNTPAFLHVFYFGNESSFTMAIFALTFFWLTRPTLTRSLVSGIVLGFGFHCRPDICFLGPFLCAWAWYNRQRAEGNPWRAITALAGSAGLTALTVWLVFIRQRPLAFTFEYFTNLKLTAGLIFYSFGPPVIAVALLGILIHARKGWPTCAVFSLLLLPVAYYTRMLSSPKYIAFMVVPLWAAAGVTLLRARWPVRGIFAAGAAAFWLCSITPFGLIPGARGAAWYLPTDDGPIPTGSYFQFFRYVHAGFFQERYGHEIEEARILYEAMDKHPGAMAAGFFNPQTAFLVRAERSIGQPGIVSMFYWPFEIDAAKHPYYLTKTAYLRANAIKPEFQNILEDWYRHGQVRVVAGRANDPFPDVIEVGGHISAGENSELGARILAALEISRGAGYVERSQFVTDYAATRWVPVKHRGEVVSNGSRPVYADAHFECYAGDGGTGTIYGGLMPSSTSLKRTRARSPTIKFRNNLIPARR